MADQWYYGLPGSRVGPCTTRELRELAAAGKVLQSDTIWKEGIVDGQAAGRVKFLFAPMPGLIPDAVQGPIPRTALDAPRPAPISKPAIEEEKPSAVAGAGTAEEEIPAEDASEADALPATEPAPSNKYVPSVKKAVVKKARALAIRGAIITSQDGTSVQYRKICSTCGNEDPTRSTMKIRTGMTRINFYCRKCRKSRSVEIQGMGC